MNENVPDKTTYQANRRRMCWVCLSLIVAMVAAILIAPEKYGSLPAFDMAFLALSGLVAAYFGAVAVQNKRK
jgi:archaellum biogenesis protein FlaJ (TadC family)